LHLPSACAVGNGNVAWFLDVPTQELQDLAEDLLLRSDFASRIVGAEEIDKLAGKREKAMALPPTAPSSFCKTAFSPFPSSSCIRLFIGGDKSHVGKSSICLGLLSSLLHHLPANQIA